MNSHAHQLCLFSQCNCMHVESSDKSTKWREVKTVLLNCFTTTVGLFMFVLMRGRATGCTHTLPQNRQQDPVTLGLSLSTWCAEFVFLIKSFKCTQSWFSKARQQFIRGVLWSVTSNLILFLNLQGEEYIQTWSDRNLMSTSKSSFLWGFTLFYSTNLVWQQPI